MKVCATKICAVTYGAFDYLRQTFAFPSIEDSLRDMFNVKNHNITLPYRKYNRNHY
jgi:hypothetical protein